MSELSKTNTYRLKKLLEVSYLILKTGNARSFILENKSFIDTVIPSDFISLFDELIKEGYNMDQLKPCSSKILNIFHKPISNYTPILPKQETFLWVLMENNKKMELILNKISPLFKAFNKEVENSLIRTQLHDLFMELNAFCNYYTIKENVLFPVIEQLWTNYRCLQLMWSFHDDIRRNIKRILEYLSSEKNDLKEFNQLVGDVFFNSMTIKFREEKILFPAILQTIDENRIEEMIAESSDIGFPFVKPKLKTAKKKTTNLNQNIVNLGTGAISVDQIKLIFNHLPVDITYVDENDMVQFFSSPKKRIFPRTTAIIGRNVHNCHPPESVHVVERIVESFKKGEKNQADFWIKMKGEYILIQYFAVRDATNNYKGVIEVTQEISSIKALDGENRLLDWE